MFDRFNEKCVIVDFNPGTSGHFISKLLYEVTHEMSDLSPMESGSYHFNSKVSNTLPCWFNADVNGLTPEIVKENLNSRLKFFELSDEPVERHVDNVLRVHSFDRLDPIFEAFPNSKVIATTIESKEEFLTSILFLITKHSIVQHPSKTRIGIVDAYKEGDHTGKLTIGKFHTPLSNVKEFTHYSNYASKSELMYLAYQLLKLFIPKLNVDDENQELTFYNGVPKNGWSDRIVELKFSWILSGNYKEVTKCFQKVVDVPFTKEQKAYLKKQLLKYKESQNQEIIANPLQFAQKLKATYLRVEDFYNQELGENK